MATYPIAEEFLSDLEVLQLKDLRLDAEILTALREHYLVSSERNIWAYWHGGADNVPPWCLRNVLDWVRICGPLWTIRIVDRVTGSSNHWSKYTPEEMLPKTTVDDWALHRATFGGLSERCATIFAWWSEPGCGLYPS